MTKTPQMDAGAAAGSFFDLQTASSSRSFWLLAIGAISGLAIAGYGLFTARGTVSNRLPPEDIALVNQRPIYHSDFVIQAQNQYSVPFAQTTPEQRTRVLNDMIDEELLVQRGLEVDLPGYDPEVRAALVNGVELQMYADVLAKQPSEEELRSYYTQHRDQYAGIGVMQLRDLILNQKADETAEASRKRAAALVAELRSGTVLDDAFMQAQGLRDSGRLFESGKPDLGDIFDFAAEAKLSRLVYTAALKLQSGEVSDPINDSDGIHIVAMKLRKPPQALDYETARPGVWADLAAEEKQKIRNNTLGYLRKKAQIQAAQDY